MKRFGCCCLVKRFDALCFSLFAKVFLSFSCKLPKSACSQKFAFAERSGAMKAPVGNALFVGIKVGRTTLAKVMPYMLMYYAAIILGLLLVTYIPAVSMVLPQVTGLV